MINQAIDRWINLCGVMPSKFASISDQDWNTNQGTGKWSRKQILGHLIDSACNNHQRFVRGQFEHLPEIGYDQNLWNKFSYYQEIDSHQLQEFWTFYNLQLIEIVKRIPPELLVNLVMIGGNSYSLSELIIDYVSHLEHHLVQIVGEL